MQKDKTKIHVIGSYAVGMTMSTARFPKVGETVPGYNFKQLHGGKGANQAIAAARLGAEVSFTTCLGCDPIGDMAMAMFEAEGLDKSTVVRTPQASTGVGFVMVGDSGDNEILIDLGANEKLTPADVDKIFTPDFAVDLLLVQLEANLEAVHYAMKLAHDRGIPVILNPAPFREVPDGFVSLASYITPNQTEAASLLGYDAEPEELCRKLQEKYQVKVIMTAGEQGAFVLDSGSEVVRVDGDQVEATDTTGAGDCFSAAFAVMLGKGMGLLDAVQRANIAAAMSVQVEGVVESLPYKADLESKLREKGL